MDKNSFLKIPNEFVWNKDNKIISTDKNVRGLNVDNKYNKLIKDKEQLEIIK